MDTCKGNEIHEEMASGERVVGCYVCGLEYGESKWVDVSLPNDIWIQISPTGCLGGLLCFQCIVDELAKKNLKTTVKLYGDTMTSLDSFHMTIKEKVKSFLFSIEMSIFSSIGWNISLYKKGSK